MLGMADRPDRNARLSSLLMTRHITQSTCNVWAELIDGLFQHVRNLMSAVAIVAAGLIASNRGWGGAATVPTLFGQRAAGWIVVGIGLALVLLNMYLGVSRVSAKFGNIRFPVRIGLVLIDAAITIRVIQVLLVVHLG